MKLLSILTLVIIVFFTSCALSNKLCTYHTKYLRKDIDTTKEYKVKGAYCVALIKDTALAGDNCVVKFNFFDRVNGRQITNGVVYFYGQDTTSIIFNSSTYQKEIKSGDYIVESWSSGFIGTKTKRLSISRGKKIEINFYLGTTVEF